MPGNEPPYEAYINELWEQAARQPDPHTVSRLVAAEACYLQVPNAEAATAQPDLAQIDGWAERIEGSKALGRMMENPKLSERIEARDAESLMTDFRAELTPRSRDKPEPERAVEKRQERARTPPEKKAPDSPTR